MYEQHVLTITSKSSICLFHQVDDYNIEGGLCRNMKGVKEVFDEKLKLITEMIEQDHLRGGFITSMDLTRYSTMSDFDDGILISELLENVFSEIGPLFEMYQIEEEDKKQLLDEIKEQISKLKQYIQKPEEKQLYLTLRQLRSIATKFQMITWEKAKRKPKPEEKG